MFRFKTINSLKDTAKCAPITCLLSDSRRLAGVPLWSFLTQEYPALLYTKVSLIRRVAALVCRAKGLGIQEILNWFNKNECHTFSKFPSEQVTKIGSAMRNGEN